MEDRSEARTWRLGESPGGQEGEAFVGALLGGCRIIERAGQGAMSVVYRAEQVKLGRAVALKVLRPGLLGEAEHAARFLIEARLAAQIEHPHIVQVYDVGEERGYHYIVMQFVQGGSLRDLIARRGRLEAAEALGMALQVAQGLEAAHQCGMIHRDIKPSNLLLDAQGLVKIADFGLAKVLAGGAELTRPHSIVGTPSYMSPEQCRGEELDPRSDLYALGVTLYEMLLGRRPFDADSTLGIVHKHLHEPVPQALRADPAISAPVAALVERLMAKRPEDRPASAQELAQEIERFTATEAAPSPAPPFDDRESFRVAEAALAVIRRRCPRFADDEAVWEAFIQWRGRGEAEYLRRIRAGGKFIFYSVLHDLYGFAEETCGENVTRAIGQELSDAILQRHMPDILRTTLGLSGSLPQQVLWLVNEIGAATSGEMYTLSAETSSAGSRLDLSLTYRSETEMVAYLARSGHDAERAFANSFAVYRGALETLLARTVYGFRPEQFTCEPRPLRGTFLLHLREENRFHHENLIEILLGHVRRLRERREPEARPAAGEGDVHLSAAMKEAWTRLRKAAASNETVLLGGESGTGKSYYARVLHDLSARRNGPFVEVGLTSEVGTDSLIQSNLFGHVRGAFTGADDEKRGLFALADGGTIFLDEIGDASPELQAKLLRVIEKKTFKMLGGVRDLAVDVRIVAATNKDLAERVRQGTFREDLYYRLNVIRIPLPPLRERREDLPALVGRLFEKVCRDARKLDKQLSADAFQLLCAHGWPGNVRELENALRHAVAFADESAILPGDLPEALRGPSAAPGGATAGLSSRVPGGTADVIDANALRRAIASAPSSPELETFECQAHIDYAKREYLKALIDHYHGDIGRIARHWDRSSENTLLKLIRELGLEDHLRAARKARQ